MPMGCCHGDNWCYMGAPQFNIANKWSAEAVRFWLLCPKTLVPIIWVPPMTRKLTFLYVYNEQSASLSVYFDSSTKHLSNDLCVKFDWLLRSMTKKDQIQFCRGARKKKKKNDVFADRQQKVVFTFICWREKNFSVLYLNLSLGLTPNSLWPGLWPDPWTMVKNKEFQYLVQRKEVV